MTEELMLTAEQGLILIAVLTVILVWLIRKPVEIEIEVKEPEKQPEKRWQYEGAYVQNAGKYYN